MASEQQAAPAGLVGWASSSNAVLLPICFACFCDFFVYGLCMPLTLVCQAGLDTPTRQALVGMCFAMGEVCALPLIYIACRRIDLARLLVSGALILLGAVVCFSLATTASLFLAARVLQGIATVLTWTAGLSILSRKFQGARLRAVALANGSGSLGFACGQALGGALCAQAATLPLAVAMTIALIASGAIAVQLCCSAISFKALRTMPSEERSTAVHDGQRTPPPAVLQSALALARPFAVLCCVAGAWGLTETQLPLHLLQNTVAGVDSFGRMIASVTCFGFVATWGLAKIGKVNGDYRARRLAPLGLSLIVLALICAADANDLPHAWLALLLMQIGYVVTIATVLTELGALAMCLPRVRQAHVYSLYCFAYALGAIVFHGLASISCTAASYPAFMRSCAFVMLAVVAWLTIALCLQLPRRAC